MATHKVLKPFDYAADGHTTRTVEAGDELSDVRPDVAAGLIAEGYIANAAAAETLSKVAGETIAAADHTGIVDDNDAVHAEIDDAKTRISDGKIGAPEARQIVDDHQVAPLPTAEAVQAAEGESTAKADGSAFDHDGDGKPGGSKPKAAKKD